MEPRRGRRRKEPSACCWHEPCQYLRRNGLSGREQIPAETGPRHEGPARRRRGLVCCRRGCGERLAAAANAEAGPALWHDPPGLWVPRARARLEKINQLWLRLITSSARPATDTARGRALHAAQQGLGGAQRPASSVQLQPGCKEPWLTQGAAADSCRGALGEGPVSQFSGSVLGNFCYFPY